MNPLYCMADVWIGRRPGDRQRMREARAAVAEFVPAVVVTGGSRGIGAAIALRFARAGNDVALVARDETALSATANDIRAQTGRRVAVIARDVAGPGSAQELDSELERQGMYGDVLVNAAGSGLSGPFAEHDPEALTRLIELNAGATAALMRHFLPGMCARRRGGVLNVASLGGIIPGPYQAAYYASKAFVISLTEATGAEVAGHGVRITAIAPGPVETSFHAAMGAERSLYRTLLPSHAPDAVARSAYRGFMLGRRIVAPGPLDSAAYLALRFVPHVVTVPLMKLLLRHRDR